MANLFVQETWIDRTRSCGLGESDVYETFTSDSGELYRSFVKEYGRCTSRVYLDKTDGTIQSIGWVFVKRKKYDDSNETFLAETWVALHEAPPTKTIEFHYHEA